MGSTLARLFTPDSIAVVGASRDPRKLGYIIVENLLRGRFRGAVHAVNLVPGDVQGLRAYPRVTDIPGPVDLAVIVVPAAAVPGVIDDCAAKGAGAAVVISAGFREAGAAGAVLEREMLERARRGGVRIVGPNSVGVINTFADLNATFAEAQPLCYEVALVSQSGAVATAILDWARGTGAGFSKFVSLGNTSDVSEAEMIEFLGDDPETKVIVAYLEGFTDARRFIAAARAVTPHKPVVAMKVGETAAGALAAASHTGALASSDRVVDGAFRQAGIVRVHTMDELFDYTLAFGFAPLPAGARVAVVTNAGGPGVMAADAVERHGLELAPLSDGSRRALREALPAAAALHNPVDVLGDARSGRYQRAMDIVLADPTVDAMVVLLTPQAVTDAELTARAIVHQARAGHKPVFASFMGGDAVERGRRILDDGRVSAFPYPERAIRALAAMRRYARFRDDLREDAKGA